MGEGSAIEWTHHTFNPWRGCAKVSAGCANCYAAVDRSVRIHGVEWGEGRPRPVKADSGWLEPLRWNRRAAAAGARERVFCASLADVFEARDDLDATRARLFELIETTPSLDWLLLTKRADQIMRRIPAWWRADLPPNVWVGVSVENQQAAEQRIPYLLRVPARVRFLSCEPLLGAVDLTRVRLSDDVDAPRVNALTGIVHRTTGSYPLVPDTDPAHGGVQWVIAGGESGPGARPVHPQWVRELRDDCAKHDVAYFFKQWGRWAPKRQRWPYHRDDDARIVYERETPPMGGPWGVLDLEGRLTRWATCWNGRDDEPDDSGYHEAYVYDMGESPAGKRAAGRLLDGRTHDEQPKPAATRRES